MNDRWNDDYDDVVALIDDSERALDRRDELRNVVAERARAFASTSTSTSKSTGERTNVEHTDAKLTVDARRNISGARTKLNILRAIEDSKAKRETTLETERERRRDACDRASTRLDALVKRVSVRIQRPKTTTTTTTASWNSDEADADGQTSRTSMDLGDALRLQRGMLEEQDEALDDLSSAAQTALHISLAVNEELDLHAKLLDGLEEEMEDTRGKLGSATRSVQNFMRRARATSCRLLVWTFLALVALALILILVIKAQKLM